MLVVPLQIIYMVPGNFVILGDNNTNLAKSPVRSWFLASCTAAGQNDIISDSPTPTKERKRLNAKKKYGTALSKAIISFGKT
jgi:hypothetical protein